MPAIYDSRLHDTMAAPRPGSLETAIGEERPWLGTRRMIARLMSRALRRQSFGWAELDAELDRCRAPMAFWWRDDDAVAATPALARLLALRSELDLPLALAVVPAHAEASLVDRLDREAAIGILQHGWDHANHAGPQAPRAEFPPGRRPDEIEAQLTEGRRRLETLFGARFIPALVPPFNALSADAVEAVRSSGLSRISLATDFAGLALPSRNVHADLIDWRLGCAVAPATAIRAIILALRLRRYGLTNAALPIGIMTHHLVHDEGIWSLARELLWHLKQHPKVAFAPINGVFA